MKYKLEYYNRMFITSIWDNEGDDEFESREEIVKYVGYLIVCGLFGLVWEEGGQ